MGQCQRFQENLAFADLAAMMGPFLLSVKPEKKDKGRKRTLLSTCPLFLPPIAAMGGIGGAVLLCLSRANRNAGLQKGWEQREGHK